jgi:hypothetical protein
MPDWTVFAAVIAALMVYEAVASAIDKNSIREKVRADECEEPADRPLYHERFEQ